MSRSYRLDPIDSTGWLLGLGPAQVGVLGCGLLVASVGMTRGLVPQAAAAIVALSGALTAARWRGRPLVTAVPVLLGFAAATATGRRSWLLTLHAANGRIGRHDQVRGPAAMAGQVVVSAEPGWWSGPRRSGPIAVVHDLRSDSWAVTLRVTGQQFLLASAEEQDRRLEGWGHALDAFCRTDRPVVTSVRWTEWSSPSGAAEQAAFIAANAAADPVPEAAAEYLRLVDTAGRSAMRHEVLATVVVEHPKRGAKTTEEACRSALAEARRFASRLEAAGLEVTGPLAPAEVGRAVRARLDLNSLSAIDRRARTLGGAAGLVDPMACGPMNTEATLRWWRTDQTWHQSFLVNDWPRTEVGAAFWSDLMLGGDCVRSVTVIYEPVPQRRAQARVRAQASRIDADADARSRRGFRLPRQAVADRRAVDQREEELVAGYSELEYVGLVTVSAGSVEDLGAACERTVQRAAGCGIDLRPLDGQHDAATVVALPLARGLSGKWR